jgi:polar amino acid transport system ATP-binding protein
MNFAREVGDRVVFMNQGKVWESGPSEVVFDDPQTEELRSFLSAVK